MKDELKDLIVSVSLMATGVFARSRFDNANKYTIAQILSLLGVGVGLILILNESNLNQVTKMSITLVYGLISPNVLRAIIRGANKSETKASDKISEKIDSVTDKIDKIV